MYATKSNVSYTIEITKYYLMCNIYNLILIIN